MGHGDPNEQWPELSADEARLVRQVSPDRLMDDTRRIASWERLSGSKAEAEAVEFVRQRLAECGIETRVIWHDALISLPGRARLVLEAAPAGAWGDAAEIGCITHSCGAPTPPEGVSGELVYAGRGTAADYEGLEACGKIALIEGLASPETTKTAEEHGVIGHIHINDEYLHEMTVSPVWGSPSFEDRTLLPRTPAFSVSEADGRRLREALAAGHVVLRMHAEVDAGWRQIPLVLGTIPGAEEPDRYVLLSGHLDSWHYGAMDNGSANATMLEVARLLATEKDGLKRGLRIAFWSGHSHGRYAGSAWYADHHWLDLERNCVAHINVDSTGGMGASVLGEANVMAEVREFAAGCVEPFAGGERFVGTRYGRAGDQSFWGHGIPALFMSMSQQPVSEGRTAESFAAIIGPGRGRAGGLGWWWHTPHDTIDKIDPGNLVRDTRAYLLATYRLCTAALLPVDYLAVCDELHDALWDIAGRFPQAKQQLCQVSVQLDALRMELERVALHLARLAWTLEHPRPGRGQRGAEAALQHANTMLMRLGRILVPAGYVAGSPYGQDAALPTGPLPGVTRAAARLDRLAPGSDEYRSGLISLTRECNRVAHAIQQAHQLAGEWHTGDALGR